MGSLTPLGHAYIYCQSPSLPSPSLPYNHFQSKKIFLFKKDEFFSTNSHHIPLLPLLSQLYKRIDLDSRDDAFGILPEGNHGRPGPDHAPTRTVTLRGKLIADGHQLPNIKMPWTRKNKYAAVSGGRGASPEPEPNTIRRKSTRFQGTQTHFVKFKLPRANKESDLLHKLSRPSGISKSSRTAKSQAPRTSANLSQETFAGGSTINIDFYDMPNSLRYRKRS